MRTRDRLIIGLRRELLGPRGGPFEEMELARRPSDEYITGVLIPKDCTVGRDPDSDVQDPAAGASSEDDAADPGPGPVVGSEVSPLLDPRSRPRSLGISFVIESTAEAKIDICATWARYKSDDRAWHRTLHSLVQRGIQLGRDHGPFRSNDDTDVEVSIRTSRIGGSSNERLRVSVYLVNITLPTDAENPSDEEMVFQPQLRVRCSEGTRRLPLVYHGRSEDAESESFELLYRNRPYFARGHLVSAVWSEIDSESANPPEDARAPPFYWEDRVALANPEDVVYFANPDVRTEYVPSIALGTLTFDWREDYGDPPELRAGILAETWNPARLKELLSPLSRGYKAWLEQVKAQAAELSEANSRLGAIALRHVRLIETCLSRIERGIELVIRDNEVRLAFCFMNKAMDLQRKWSDRGPRSNAPSIGLTWRPFQLAFILMTIEGVEDSYHPDRDTCDLIGFPTGGGKTEAYLGLAVFAMAIRRLSTSASDRESQRADGVTVISRYTLRLLTIQQFRRALAAVTACDYLRVFGVGAALGWRPSGYTDRRSGLWGVSRFSIGLWVGAGVTPNHLATRPVKDQRGRVTEYAGALDTLRGVRPDDSGMTRVEVEGDPAQVLSCPVCATTLAISSEGLDVGDKWIHIVVQGVTNRFPPSATFKPSPRIKVLETQYTPLPQAGYGSAAIHLHILDKVSAEEFDDWLSNSLSRAYGDGTVLVSARPSRPGYFMVGYEDLSGREHDSDFEIRCPNWQSCDLNRVAWSELVPVSLSSTHSPPSTAPYETQSVPRAFRSPSNPGVSVGMPIPAYTVDDQIYHRIPSMIVATVDKFARLPFEPRAGAIFGNVDHYHSRWGYYREGLPGGPFNRDRPHPPAYAAGHPLHREIIARLPPALVIQDELHLIEGPLGSMVGIYESVIDELSSLTSDGRRIRPKYVASTATIRLAEQQVASLFNRKMAVFPPPGITSRDNFFSMEVDASLLDRGLPGRAFVGVSVPGKAQTVGATRIWALLLQAPSDALSAGCSLEDVDRYWTLVGYFNSLRELAGTLTLYQHDIPDRMPWVAQAQVRDVDFADPLFLNGTMRSERIPGMLDRLSKRLQDQEASDAAFATSMFGTGVDVLRLSLMVVHGQPKTTSAYIQATGRVGREAGGLVIAYLPATRPRDLNLYEHFAGFHLSIQRHVEPITVFPFAPRVRDRSLGPLSVALLRNGRTISGAVVDQRWALDPDTANPGSGSGRMSTCRNSPEVLAIPVLFETRSQTQPSGRRPNAGDVSRQANEMIDRWEFLSRLPECQTRIKYQERPFSTPSRPVILGDEQHLMAQRQHRLTVGAVFDNTPKSLREIESTTTFGE